MTESDVKLAVLAVDLAEHKLTQQRRWWRLGFAFVVFIFTIIGTSGDVFQAGLVGFVTFVLMETGEPLVIRMEKFTPVSEVRRYFVPLLKNDNLRINGSSFDEYLTNEPLSDDERNRIIKAVREGTIDSLTDRDVAIISGFVPKFEPEKLSVSV